MIKKKNIPLFFNLFILTHLFDFSIRFSAFIENNSSSNLLTFKTAFSAFLEQDGNEIIAKKEMSDTEKTKTILFIWQK